MPKPAAAASARQALQRGSTKEFGRIAATVLLFCAWKGGTAPESSNVFTSSALEATGALRSISPNEAFADVLDLTLAAAIEFSGLRVAAAESLARCALRRAQGSKGPTTVPGSVLARILYEQGQRGTL